MTIFFYHPGASSIVGLGPSDTAYSEGFTLGLSKLSKADITTDIIHCDTTVDVQPDATACDVFQSEEESRSRSHYIEREAAGDSQTEEGDGDPEHKAHLSARSGFVEEEDETAKDSQAEEGDEDSQPEVDASTRLQSQEDHETGQSFEEECSGNFQPKVDVPARSRSVEEEDETAQDSQTETGDGDCQPEVDASTRSESQKDQETGQNAEEEECGGDSQPKVDVPDESRSVEDEDETAQDSQTLTAQTKEVSAVDCHSEEEENIADDERDRKNSTQEDLSHSQAEDEELEEGGDGHQSEEQEHAEHHNYRDHCSGGGVINATEPDGVTSEMGENSKKILLLLIELFIYLFSSF